MKRPDAHEIKRHILEIIEKHEKSRSSMVLQINWVATQTMQTLFKKSPGQDPVIEKQILSIFNDLFRSGLISWGKDITNPSPPLFHMTTQGEKVLKQLSQDPYNPAGYLKKLEEAELDEITFSYLEEALGTLNAGYYKSAAFMTGAAVENLILNLRDELINMGIKHSDLRKNQNISTIIDRVEKELDKLKANMGYQLKESYEFIWGGFIHKIKTSRNNTGHPQSLKLFRQEDAYTALLMFPGLAILINDLKKFLVGLKH